jgi:hypothetical protein
MAMKKVSVTLDAELVAEAKGRLGDQAFSHLLNEALALHLQGLRIEQFERESSREFGPIPEDVQREVEAQEWPR